MVPSAVTPGARPPPGHRPATARWYGHITRQEHGHSTQHTAHCKQHTAHSTPHTAHSTQHTAHSTRIDRAADKYGRNEGYLARGITAQT